MYRLASTLVKVYNPHLYHYRIWDRLTDKTLGDLWRLAPCKYSKISGSHMTHAPFIKEHFVYVSEAGEEVINLDKYGGVLKFLNDRYFKDDNPVCDMENTIFLNFLEGSYE